MFQRILVPTDGTDITAKAVDTAIGMAKVMGARLYTLSVKEPFPYSAISEMQPTPPQEFYDAQERIAATRVQAVRDACSAAGLACEAMTVEALHPWEAIIGHEIPQEVGDYIVLLNAGFSRAKALAYNAVSGLSAVVGGVIGYFVVGPWEALFPYLLVVASSSFVYVAVADLIPQLQQRMSMRDTAAQLAWLGGGMAMIVLVVRAIGAH